MAMMRVRAVAPLPEHRLAVTFSDGTSGVADLREHVLRAPFLALRDEAVFREVFVEHGAVEWPRGDVGIATEALYALAHGLPRPMTSEQVDENELTVSLREMRKLVGQTQSDAAAAAGVTQSALSQFEAAPDHKVSAVRRHVESLGGVLEIAAVFGSKRLTLRGV